MMRYFHLRDKEILGRFSADYQIYGVKLDGSQAYLTVLYDGRALPEFETVLFDSADTVTVH
jgi:hypothetical protein